MRQETLNKLFDITDQISEAYIAEAMPHSLRYAHQTIKHSEIHREEQEKRPMNISMTRYIGTGFAAAAALAVVIGGGVLISRLRGDDPGRVGNSNITTAAVQTETTATQQTTSATETERTTELTTALTTALTAADTPPLETGYGHDLSGMPAVLYQMKDGELTVLSDGGFTISDGSLIYKTGADGALTRSADGKKLFRPDEASQKGFRYTSMTPAGGGWYFVTAVTGDYSADSGSLWWMPVNDGATQYCWWYSETTGQAQPLTLQRGADDSSPFLLTTFIQADPDGGAVYAMRNSGDTVCRIPVPGGGTEKDYRFHCAMGESIRSVFTPVSGGKVLYLEGNDALGRNHGTLGVLNTADGSTTTLLPDENICAVYSQNGRVLALKASGKAVYEYLPADNTLRTAADLSSVEELPGGHTYYDTFTTVWDDFAVINGKSVDDENNAYSVAVLVNLNDGTFTELE